MVRQLWNSFNIFSVEKNAKNDHILNLIIKCFRKFLLRKEVRAQMVDSKYISALSSIMNSKRCHELMFNSAICLAHYSEDMRAHNQLERLDVLKSFCKMLKETKQKKLHNQACRFLSNISWNPRYSNILLDNNIVPSMISLLSNQPNVKLIKYCIFAIGNLSATPNFFSKCHNLSINSIINLLDYNGGGKEEITEYASFALANISLDQSTHVEILKEPEISIVHKNFVQGSTPKIIKNLMILVTNLAMNQRLNIKLLQKDFFKKAIDLMIDENAKHYKRYIAKAIASLSFLSEFQEYIYQNDLMARLLSSVYHNDDSTKETIFLSIFTMVKNMTELRNQFFKAKGTNMINYFLNKPSETSEDLNYVAVKFLVYLSETAEFQTYISTTKDSSLKGFVSTIVSFSDKNAFIERKDFRCIKEGIRYLINLSLMKRETNSEIVSGLCSMCKACILSNNANNVSLAFLGLKLISQNHKNHSQILNEPNLFDYILKLDDKIIEMNAKIITIFCFNMLINEEFQKRLLEKRILALLNKLVVHADECGISQVQVVIASLIKRGHTRELLDGRVEDILLNLLSEKKKAIINGIYFTFYVDFSKIAIFEREDKDLRWKGHLH